MQEETRPGEYIAHEEDRSLTRKKVTLASGHIYLVGMVLGQNASTKRYHPLNPAASDGTQVAKGINHKKVDASSSDNEAVITSNLTAVTDEDLVWPSGISVNEKLNAIEQLDNRNIVVK